MAKPLLVGELNPYGADPKFALYPEPRGASGDRLCRKILGLSGGLYMAAFDRVNLCTGRFSAETAREKATALLAGEWQTYVLLGGKARDAFGLEPGDPDFFDWCWLSHEGGKRLVLLPHPSGINRMWRGPESIERARKVLRETGVLPAEEEKHGEDD